MFTGCSEAGAQHILAITFLSARISGSCFSHSWISRKTFAALSFTGFVIR